MIDQVRAFARRHALWAPGSRVLVALSGGGDSVALLLLLHDLAARGELTLVGAAHVNHHVRPVEGDEDERFCRVLASRLAVPLLVKHADVPALAAARGQSLEVAGRVARRAALLECAAALDADHVATAHTLDDQAETVLLRILRGAGLRGLTGIEPRRDVLVRPLLGHTRHDLRRWLQGRGESWREDATNADRANPRNRVRHELVPYLRTHFNPSAAAALARLADLARLDDMFLAELAAEAAARVVRLRPDGVEIDAGGLAALPQALARRVARLALETAAPSRTYDLCEVDKICEACLGRLRGGLDLRNLRMEPSAAGVVLSSRGLAPRSAPFRYELSIPGSVSVAEANCRVEASAPAAPGAFAASGALEVAVDAAGCGERLIVRSRVPGDRMRLAGRGGRRKLQDLFIDRKIGRTERAQTPIVTDPENRIVWVAGLALAEEFRVSDRTKAVVVLKLRRF
jgi:tRNA(Ile)-lysidine synthase